MENIKYVEERYQKDRVINSYESEISMLERLETPRWVEHDGYLERVYTHEHAEKIRDLIRKRNEYIKEHYPQLIYSIIYSDDDDVQELQGNEKVKRFIKDYADDIVDIANIVKNSIVNSVLRKKRNFR